MTESRPRIVDLKAQAKRLRVQLEAMGTRVSHSKSLELVAQQHGCRDWNTISASAAVRPRTPLCVGDCVRGHYLSMPFTAKVIGVQILKQALFRITLQFDEAVDVVKASNFSDKRKRVTCTIDSAGIAKAKTLDGVPHLALED